MTALKILAAIGWLFILLSVVAVVRRHLQDTASISERYRSWRYHRALRAQARRRRHRVRHVHRFIETGHLDHGWTVVTCVQCGHEELRLPQIGVVS